MLKFGMKQGIVARGVLLAMAMLLVGSSWCVAAEPTAEQIKGLETKLTGCKFTGLFTVTGGELGKTTPEEYTITSAMKLTEGDLWMLKARIKYGGTDSTIPIPLEIKWAGDTPVITMDKITLPGLGTFSARVVIHEDRYAGTWQHDAVGGHLFGTISKGEAKPEPEKKAEKK